MNKVFLGIGATLLALALTSSAEAKGGRGPGGHSASSRSASSRSTSSASMRGYGYGHGAKASFGNTRGARYHSRYDYSKYSRSYGTSFRYGTYYRGHDHYHWDRYSYSVRHRCTFYRCPSTSCWYYWSAPACCYYPVSYLSVVPPTPVEGPPELDSLPRAPEGAGPELPAPMPRR